mmetsp:Transcript_24898/g.72013  ORF Transcript_24898/g.72013 Transcript_24898/m.72013 type:complete len:324 (-) Transcript_24898:7-978(-)
MTRLVNGGKIATVVGTLHLIHIDRASNRLFLPRRVTCQINEPLGERHFGDFLVAQILKVRLDLTQSAIINGFPPVQHVQIIKLLEGSPSWRMNCARHSSTISRQLPQQFNNLIGSTGVQTTGGFVEKQHLGTGNESQTDVDPLGLSTANTPHERRADHCMTTLVQIQPGNHLIDPLPPFLGRRTGRQLERGGVFQHLLDGQLADQRVELLDISDDALVVGSGRLAPIEGDASRDLARILPAGQHIKEGRFARPTWSHQRNHLSRKKGSTDGMQNGELVGLFFFFVTVIFLLALLAALERHFICEVGKANADALHFRQQRTRCG